MGRINYSPPIHVFEKTFAHIQIYTLKEKSIERDYVETSTENTLPTIPNILEQTRSTHPAEPDKSSVGIPVVISLCLFIAIITSLTSLYVYDRWYVQKMVAVDIRGYITEQRNAYIAGKLTDEQLKGKFDDLERVVTSIPKNKIVIMGDAVVRNVEVVKIP